MTNILPPGYVKWDGIKYVLDPDIEIIGPAGAPGAQGIPGPIGPAGVTGATGPAGSVENVRIRVYRQTEMEAQNYFTTPTYVVWTNESPLMTTSQASLVAPDNKNIQVNKSGTYIISGKLSIEVFLANIYALYIKIVKNNIDLIHEEYEELGVNLVGRSFSFNFITELEENDLIKVGWEQVSDETGASQLVESDAFSYLSVIKIF